MPTAKQLLHLYVSEALQNKARASDCVAYFRVVNELSSLKRSVRTLDEEKQAHLTSMLYTFATCVSLVTLQAHETLMMEILSIPIWGPSAEIRQSLLAVLIHLVVNNTHLTNQCLNKMVDAYLPPAFLTASKDANMVIADVEICQVQDEVSVSIERLLALVPTAPALLVAAAAAKRPHPLRDRVMHVCYVRGILKLALGCTSAAVRAGLLAVVVEHLVDLDVEIKWQDIAIHPEDEAEEEEVEDEDIFELEGQAGQLHVSQPGVAAEAVEMARGGNAREGFEGTVAESRAGLAAATSTSGRSAADHFAEKLDSLMEMVLQHMEGAMQQGEAGAVWDALLPVFQRYLMRTDRCKFAQYLLWYGCMQRPEAAQSFVDVLFAMLTDPATLEPTRASAAAYLASFLARARFLPPDFIIQALHRLTAWCTLYCAAKDKQQHMPGPSTPMRASSSTPSRSSSTPGGISLRGSKEDNDRDLAARHQAFYAGFQGLLYVLCYRLTGLASPHVTSQTAPSSDASACLHQLLYNSIPQLLSHWLSPLMVCLPSVALEFTSLGQQFGFLPQHTAALRATAVNTRTGRPLEMFFPFDPYLLRTSAARLELRTSYLKWGQVKALAAGLAAANNEALHGQDASSSSSSSGEEESDASGTSSSEEESDMEYDDTDHPSDVEMPHIYQSKAWTIQPGDHAASPDTVGGLSPATPASQATMGLPMPGTYHRLGGASRGSSPDPGSSEDPMSWTPHIPLHTMR